MKAKKLIIFFVSMFFIELALADSNYNPLTRGLADTLYCRQGGNCNISNMTINQINYTYSSVNITNNLNVVNNVTAYWLIGNIDFLNIQNWNWNTVYNNIKSLINGDFYNKVESDARYSNGTSSTTFSSGTEGTSVYALNSKTNEVKWNVSQSENEEYKFYVYDNINLVPIGGEMQ